MNYNQLEPSAYTDEKIFAKEMDKIFSNSWQFCGLLEDLPAANDYITVKAGNNHLVVFKDAQGQLGAFHNICRHRGMQIFAGKGKLADTITCPYHDWRYDQQGQLRALPNQRNEFAELDKSCYSLKKAQVGIWRGMIWVHPDINAIPANEYFAPLNQHLAPYQVEDLYESTEQSSETIINANWKIVAENYIDQYHLAQLHVGSLNMYNHQKAEFGTIGEHFHFWEPVTRDYLENIEANAPYPLLIDKNHPKIGAWVPLLFPNLGLSETESSWSLFHIVPITVDKTKVVTRSKVKNCSSLQFVKQATRSYGFWQKKSKAKSDDYDSNHPLGSGDFMAEDVYVCEQLQKSLKSRFFEFGPSAEKGESMVREFQLRVKEWLGK